MVSLPQDIFIPFRSFESVSLLSGRYHCTDGKKNLVLNLSRDERRQFIERSSDELPLTTQAELLSLNRSSLYYQPQPPSATEIGIKHRIDELYTRWPFYGSRRITVHLQREGVTINRKTVQRHMREMGIEGVSPGPNLSKRT